MMKRFTGLVLTLVLAVTLFSGAVPQAKASDRVYYNIDFSSLVAKTTVLMHLSSDCSIASMATIEAYMHGATSASDRDAIYEAVVEANGDDTYAYWSNVGYQTYYSIDWEDIYHRLEQGVPSIVHRTSGNGHWSVVAGYEGPSSYLDPDDFIVVNVYTGKGGNFYPSKNYDVKTVGSWCNGSDVDRMILRKDGLAVTELSGGIATAVNLPAYVRQPGAQHRFTGYIVSGQGLSSVRTRLINARNGEVLFDRNDSPGSRRYQFSRLDSKLDLGDVPEGEYFFVVQISDNGGNYKTLRRYFVVSSSWPRELPQEPVYSLHFNPNGGSGRFDGVTLAFGDAGVSLPANPYHRDGYEFTGWSLHRSDGFRYCASTDTWLPEGEIERNGYALRRYAPGEYLAMDWYMLTGGSQPTYEYTLYAQWRKLCDGNHTWDAGVITKNPTGTEAGIRTRSCIHCGETQDQPVPPNPHQHVYAGDICEICGEKSREIPVTPMYRLYNPNTGEHFYTGSVCEWEMLVNAGWHYEGVAWNAPTEGGDPVYRLFNPNSGDHHYTRSRTERENLRALGWIYEGIAWNSAGDDQVKQYRLYNPNAKCGSHHYTSSREERNALMELGWIYEGVGWYGLK